MRDALDRVEDEEIGVHFGSSEYKNAKQACQKAVDTLEKLNDRGSDYQMSDYEVEQFRDQLENAAENINTYLTKKNKEAAKNDGTLSATSQYRVEAMRQAQKSVEFQMAVMDELLVRRGLEQPIPSDQILKQQRDDLSKEMAEAQRNVHNGSEEYNNAQTEYEKLNSLWAKTMENKAENELPSAGEIETLKASVDKTRQSVDEYLQKKSDMKNPGPKTQKRITAMSRVKANLELQTRKLEAWEKKLAEQEPVKDYEKLAEETTYLRDHMQAADRGVIGGSKEYKAVNDLLTQQEEKWKEFAKKGKDYKMSPEELKEMVELNQRMEKAVDQYIADKAGKDLSSKTQKRLRTIQKVKNHNLSQRRKFEARRDEMLKEVEGLSNQQVENSAREISQGVRNANRRVYFGSRAYDNAMLSYNRSLQRWNQYREAEEKGVATPVQRADEKKALESNIRQIDKYLDSKKNKNLDKNPKTKKRVEIMQQAKKNLQIRIQKIELAEKKVREAQREQRKQQTRKRREELQFGLKSQQALERNMARASVSAINQLSNLSNRKTLTEMDRKNARTALAAMVLEDRLKQPGNEPLKRELAKGGKQYASAVKKIANSKEFKQAFPDNTLTPVNCKNLANNPKVAERCAKEFNNRMVQKAQAQKQMKQQMTRQKQNVRNIDPNRK